MPTDRALRRRIPVQERSRARVERILLAAAEILEADGSEAVTTRAVAARAEVPVATLYQFFANRDALLEELLLRDVDRRDDQMATRLQNLDVANLGEAVATIFELHEQNYRAHPEIVALYYAGRARGRIPDPEAHRARLAAMVHAALLERGLLRAGTDETVTRVAIELADRAVELAYSRSPNGDRTVLAEGVTAVTRYLEHYSDVP